jgi:hypothetical protein
MERGKGVAGDAQLRLLEFYDAGSLARDLLARRPIRLSVPESVARLLALRDLDWSREVELPRGAPLEIPDDHQQLIERMAALDDRYRYFMALTYARGGRILYTMLGGSRYAARVDWDADRPEQDRP